MSSFKRMLPLILRIIISALFLLSAVAKMFPIWAFEKQLVDLNVVSWCNAPILARFIIAAEAAIAIAILQKHYIRSIVIPVTILLLVAFCMHLGIQMYQHGAMNGNCGCFGQLIPMTPLEAFLKNVATIGLLIYLRTMVSDNPRGENRFVNLLFYYSLTSLLLFVFYPFKPCEKEVVKPDVKGIEIPIDTSAAEIAAGSAALPAVSPDKTQTDPSKKDTGKVKEVVNPGPAKTKSKFSEFTEFSGKKVNLDEGKKIVCLFVPGCDHCRHACKEIVALSKKNKLPPVYILFMDEELFKLPEFYRETGCKYPYHVISDIPKFFKLLGNNGSTPGVFYLWNGNIIKSYQGTEGEAFKPEEMMRIMSSDRMN